MYNFGQYGALPPQNFGAYQPYAQLPMLGQQRPQLQQQPLPPAQVQQQPQPVQVVGLQGRPVSSIEEAKACPANFDGSQQFFPDKAAGKIYVKYIDLNGLTVFEIYEKKHATTAQPALNNDELAKQFEQLKEEFQKLKDSLGG